MKIHSMYWDNIDPRIPEYQKKVFDKLGLKIIQHRLNGVDHGTWVDWVLFNEKEADVILFMDIDCIPLCKSAIDDIPTICADGTLYGAAGCANHLDKNRAYVGAWFMAVNVNTWNKFGRPTCRALSNSDVAQNLTDAWLEYKQNVVMVYPSKVDVPLWDLPGMPNAYGHGTTYGNVCYHLFESRNQTNIDRFITKCEEVLNEK